MRIAKCALAILLLLPVFSGCSSVRLRPLTTGEARLTYLEMPDMVQEDLSYEVILTIVSDEKPLIKKVCFRWVAEQNRSASPSLYSYSMDASFAKGVTYTGWGGPETPVESDSFCAGPEDIRTDIPGKLVVKIRPLNMKDNYNKLIGYAEYVTDGRIRTTNKVGTNVNMVKYPREK